MPCKLKTDYIPKRNIKHRQIIKKHIFKGYKYVLNCLNNVKGLSGGENLQVLICPYYQRQFSFHFKEFLWSTFVRPYKQTTFNKITLIYTITHFQNRYVLHENNS